MTNRAEFERLLDVYGFRCERFGQDLSTHARAQVVSAFAALASAPVAGEAKKPVAYRAWFDQDSGARWLFTLWPEEERLDVQWQPLYAAPQASEAVPNLPRGWQLALNLAIDAIENAAPAGQDWPVNWPAILHGLVELRAALSAQPGAQRTGGSE